MSSSQVLQKQKQGLSSRALQKQKQKQSPVSSSQVLQKQKQSTVSSSTVLQNQELQQIDTSFSSNLTKTERELLLFQQYIENIICLDQASKHDLFDFIDNK